MKSDTAGKTVKHFTDLDGLRGVLALGVVVLHFGVNALVARVTLGFLPGVLLQLSVDFFFILSGFVLAHSMANKQIEPWRFAVKRAWRLLPVHYVTFAASVAVLAANPRLPLLSLWGAITPVRVVSDALLVSPLNGSEPLNFPAWSIAWELFLPIVAVVLVRSFGLFVARWSALLLILLGFGASALAWRVACGDHFYGLRALAGLLGGALLYRWRAKVPGIAGRAVLTSLLLAMAMVMLFAVRFPLIAITFPWLAALSVLVGSYTQTMLSAQPCAFLGRISYPLYMVHVPVLAFLYLLFGDVSGNVTLKAVGLALSIALAATLAFTIERWGIRKGNG